jgi:transcriptional regulator with XRE-family HTH domain
MYNRPLKHGRNIRLFCVVYFVFVKIFLSLGKKMFLSENLKHLRNKAGLSQKELSEKLQIGRSTLAEYERGKAEPNIDTLMKLASTFSISLDQLISQNLRNTELEIFRNKDMRVLAITMDRDKKGNIELVDTKAEAGYLESAQDPEYIRELPKIWFPNIPEGSYRGFEIQGDSMLPVEPGTIIISRYVEQLSWIKNDKTYIVITQRDGLVYKRIRINEQRNTLSLISDNPVYAPYEVAFSEVREMWEHYAQLSFTESKKLLDQMLEEKITEIHKMVSEMHSEKNKQAKA